MGADCRIVADRSNVTQCTNAAYSIALMAAMVVLLLVVGSVVAMADGDQTAPEFRNHLESQ